MTKKNATRLPLGQRIATGAISAVLGLTMTIPFGTTAAIAEEASKTNGSDAEKDEQSGTNTAATAKREVVYTKTDATGKSSGSYVVNAFETAQKQDVSDPGTYEKVKNLTTSQKLKDEGGSVDLTTVAGEPFYYQGDLSADTQLPWDVQITYRLDGKEISPDKLAGKDGDLDIELKVTGLDDESATADFAKSFILQAQGTFPNKNFDLDTADNATIAANGSNTVLTYMLIPGQNGDWHIKGKASDFTYSGWQIAAMPLNLDLDLKNYDLSELTDATSQLQDGVDELDNGGKTLSQALGQIDAGADSAASGSATLANGADTLAAGTGTLASGANTLAAGTGTLANGAGQLAAGTSQAVAGTKQAAAGGKQVADGADQLASGTSQLDSGASSLKQGAVSLVASLDSQKNEIGTLKEGMDTLANSLTSMPTTMKDASDKLNGIKGQLDDINTKVSALSAAANGSQTSQLKAAAEDAAAQAQTLNGQVKALESSLANANVEGNLNEAGSSLQNADGSIAGAAQDAGSAAADAQSAASDASDAASALNGIDTTGMTDAQIKAIKSAAASAQSAAGSASTAAQSAGSSAQKSKAAGDSVTSAGENLKSVSGPLSQLKGNSIDASKLKGDLTAIEQGSQGVASLIDQAQGVSNSAVTVVNESQQLLQTTQQTVNGLSAKLGQINVLHAGVNQLANSVTTDTYSASGNPTSIHAAASALAKGASQLSAGTTSANTGAQKLAGGARQLKSGLDTLSSGSTQLNSGAQSLKAGANQVNSGASSLASGAGRLNSGAGTLANGAHTLQSGLGTLANGTGQAYDGSKTLASGLDTLAESVDGMDQKVLDKIQDTIDEKLGRDYQLHSFVDSDNTNVKEVQFVYVVDGVKEPEKKSDTKSTDDDDSTKNQSFSERLSALFSKDKKDED